MRNDNPEYEDSEVVIKLLEEEKKVQGGSA